MFGYEYILENNLTILEVNDGKGTKARFVPERGGILAELDLSGVTVFYLDKETLHNPNKNIRGGNPVLFPICGPLENGQYRIGDAVYKMGQHGFARDMEWKVEEISCSFDCSLIKLTLDSGAKSKEKFPYDFRLEFIYEITPLDVTIRQKYINNSLEAMPFYAGFHPYFYVRGIKLNKLKIPAVKYRDVKTGINNNFEGALNFQAVPETNLVFDGLTENKAWFERADGHKVEVVFDKWFRYLVVWVLRDREFLCLEPWMGDNYDMNRGQSLTIKPGECLATKVIYKVI